MERTFHHDRSDLHGITVVVETTGAELWVGRCDDEDVERVILLDADVHREGEGGVSRDEWLGKASRFGVWPNHRRVVLPRRAVASLRRLGVCAAETQGRVASAVGPDTRRRDAGDAEASSRSGNDVDGPTPSQPEGRMGVAAGSRVTRRQR